MSQMQLKLRDIMGLNAGLSMLDTYQRVIKDKEGVESQIQDRYKIAGTVRLAIAKNINAVKVAVDTFQKASNDLIQELSDGGQQVPQEKIGEFQKQQQAMLDQEQEIALVKLKPDLLNLDENPIPAQVLALLDPILDA